MYVRVRPSLCVGSVRAGVCLPADIVKRCKVKVRVSSTQLSPSELFIKIPRSPFQLLFEHHQSGTAGGPQGCRGFHCHRAGESSDKKRRGRKINSSSPTDTIPNVCRKLNVFDAFQGAKESKHRGFGRRRAELRKR